MSSNRAKLLYAAQGGYCGSCGHPMLKPGRRPPYRHDRWFTIDHVWPRSAGHNRYANALGMHQGCNVAKGNRDPNGCELVMLALVNAKLGVED